MEVMCVPAVSGPLEAPKAFAKLERVVPLKGRKFYGVENQQIGEYRACTKLQEEDNPSQLGLEVFTIPGGLYAYEKLEGRYQDIIKQIGPTFARLNEQYRVDPSRPSIEFYKRFTEFILYLPIIK